MYIVHVTTICTTYDLQDTNEYLQSKILHYNFNIWFACALNLQLVVDSSALLERNTIMARIYQLMHRKLHKKALLLVLLLTVFSFPIHEHCNAQRTISCFMYWIYLQQLHWHKHMDIMLASSIALREERCNLHPRWGWGKSIIYVCAFQFNGAFNLDSAVGVMKILT